MTTTRQVVDLIRSHGRGDDRTFLSIAEHIASEAAKAGQAKVAQNITRALEQFRKPDLVVELPRELQGLITLSHPKGGFDAMVLPDETRATLVELLEERAMAETLAEYGLRPRRKLLLCGPSGTGKTMTAAAIAAELSAPLHVAQLGGIVSRFMGETSAKLCKLFEAMTERGGVWLFDEFDALAASRERDNDVGEARRILNTLLTLIEEDRSDAVIVAATNLPQLLDRAIFRRFDTIIKYDTLDGQGLLSLLKATLAPFDTSSFDWDATVSQSSRFGQADVVAACCDAGRQAVMRHAGVVQNTSLERFLQERLATCAHPMPTGPSA